MKEGQPTGGRIHRPPEQTKTKRRKQTMGKRRAVKGKRGMELIVAEVVLEEAKKIVIAF